ncbi:hypothetical protein Hanom_Chr02g00127281 [Helianthus anomalus]
MDTKSGVIAPFFTDIPVLSLASTSLVMSLTVTSSSVSRTTFVTCELVVQPCCFLKKKSLQRLGS